MGIVGIMIIRLVVYKMMQIHKIVGVMVIPKIAGLMMTQRRPDQQIEITIMERIQIPKMVGAITMGMDFSMIILLITRIMVIILIQLIMEALLITFQILQILGIMVTMIIIVGILTTLLTMKILQTIMKIVGIMETI